MRRPIYALLALAVLPAAPAALAQHDHDHAMPAGKPAHPTFDKFKALEGTWTGTAGPKGGEASASTVTYKLTGGGSALIETLYPGTPHEMVTVYYLDGSELRLTHYCAAGNQPTMKLAGSDGKTLHFDFLSGTNMKLSDMHMHAASITFVDANHIRTEWTAWRDGKPAEVMVFELGRKS